MKNVSVFVVLGAFIISVVLTGCADLDNALSNLKVDPHNVSLTEDIDRAKTVKKLSYLTDSASRTLRSSEQGPTQLQPLKPMLTLLERQSSYINLYLDNVL